MTPGQQQIVMSRPIDFGIGGSGLLTGLQVQGAEFNGAGFDFTYPITAEQVRIKDTVTTANDYRGTAQAKLTYTSPSVKITRKSNGLWTANTLGDLPFHWDASGAPMGLLIEPARTNVVLWNSDLTNAAWVRTTLNVAKSATGPDGVANSATLCTATAANATVMQAITSASGFKLTSMFVKRRTGSGTINITQDTGTVWTAVTVTNDWTRVQSSFQSLSNSQSGLRIVTSGDEVEVALFQQEVVGGPGAGAVITTPIVTTTASVTRAIDNISIVTSALPFSTTTGTIIATYYFEGFMSDAQGKIWALNDGTANERMSCAAPANSSGQKQYFYTVDGGVDQQLTFTSTLVTAATLLKGAAAWAVNDFAVLLNAGGAGTDTAGTLPTVTKLEFGYDTTTATSPLNGYLQKLVYIKRRLANAELQEVTR